MESQVENTSPSEKLERANAIEKLEQRHVQGANWFFWIAALSLVNSAVIHAGGNWSFVVGLGSTQVVDAIAAGAAVDAGPGAAAVARTVAIAMDVMVAGLFALFGVFARKRHTWAYIVGSVLYALDGLLFLVVQDWMSIGFHVFALVGLAGGLSACRKVAAASAPPKSEPVYEPITP